MHDTIDPALRQLIADVISSMTDGGEFMSMLPRGKADLVYHLRERGRQDLAERIEAGPPFLLREEDRLVQIDYGPGLHQRETLIDFAEAED